MGEPPSVHKEGKYTFHRMRVITEGCVITEGYVDVTDSTQFIGLNVLATYT